MDCLPASHMRNSDEYRVFPFLMLGDEIVRIIIDFLDISALLRLHCSISCNRKLLKYIGSQICSIHTGILTIFHTASSYQGSVRHLSGRQSSSLFRDWVFKNASSTRRICANFPANVESLHIEDIVASLSRIIGRVRGLTELIVRIEDCNRSQYTAYSSQLRGSILAASSAGFLRQLHTIAIDIGFSGSTRHAENIVPQLRRFCPKLTRLDGFSSFDLQDCLEYLCVNVNGREEPTWVSIESIDLAGLIQRLCYLATVGNQHEIPRDRAGAFFDIFDVEPDLLYRKVARLVLSHLTPRNFPSLRSIDLVDIESSVLFDVFEAFLYTHCLHYVTTTSSVTDGFVGEKIQVLKIDLASIAAHEHIEYSQRSDMSNGSLF